MGTPVVTNIISGGAVVYRAPVAETNPDESTIFYGAAWGGNWERIGFTKAPLTVAYSFDEAEIEVEEELSPIDRLRIKEMLTLETVLAELAAEYFALSLGQDPTTAVTSTAAGAGQRAYEEVLLGGNSEIKQYKWGFEARYVDSAGDEFPVRFFIHKGTAKLNGNLEFSQKSGDYPGIPLQINALADPSQSAGQKLFQFQRVTAKATDE